MATATKKAAKPKATKSDPMAVLFAALEKGGKNQGDRAKLAPGSTPVNLVVSGTVGRKTIHETLTGNLVVGADSTTADNKKPDSVSLVALLLSKFSKRKRESVLLEIEDTFKAAKGKPPKLADGDISQAAELLEALTVSGTKPKAGTVQFEAAA